MEHDARVGRDGIPLPVLYRARLFSFLLVGNFVERGPVRLAQEESCAVLLIC